MTIFFAGGELDVFNPITTQSIETNAIAAAYDAAFSRCAIRLGNTSGAATGAGTGISTDQLGNLTSLWVSWWDYQQDNSNNYDANNAIAQWLNIGGVAVIRALSVNATLNKQFQVWNGVSAWTNLGAPIPHVFANRKRYDVFIDFPNQVFRVYVGNVLTLDLVLPVSSIGFSVNVFQLNNQSRFGSPRIGYTLVSEIIVADEPTLNMRVKTIPAVADGAETQWNGVVANINELALDDAAGIDTGLTDQLRTFTIADVSGFSNYSVRALCIGRRASSNGVSPDNIEGIIRVAGVNYFSANVALPVGISGGIIAFNTNPATGTGFVLGDLTAANLQFGFASRA